MADRLTPDARSHLMARIRSKDTKPELAVRHLLHRMGYRFRLHRRDLLGSPDIVLPVRRKIVFVHGCFWHGHTGCRFATTPATRIDFWTAKISATKQRDARAVRQLRRSGWSVAVVWECQTRSLDQLARRLEHFLEKT